MKKGWVGIGANKAYIKQIIVYLAKWNEDIVMNIYIPVYIYTCIKNKSYIYLQLFLKINSTSALN